MCVTLPNFIKIGQTVAGIWRFNSFHNVGRPPSWILEIEFFNGLGAYDPFCIIMPNFAKTKICQSFVVISRFVWLFKMTTTAILFFKFQILTVCPLSGANLRHRATFHQNRSNGCGDMAI